MGEKLLTIEEKRVGESYPLNNRTLVKKKEKRSIHIKRTFKKGRVLENRFFKVFFEKGEETEGGFAVVVGKKFGNAVERNRIKRIYREILRKHKSFFEKKNLIILPRGPSKKVSFGQLKEKVKESLKGFDQGFQC
jgi:ribonuclease P protein component